MLRPSATLHAQRVASATPDGSGFEAEVAAALAAMGVASPFISRRRRVGSRRAPRTIDGYALSCTGSPPRPRCACRRAASAPIGALGWGIFVPAKTIADGAGLKHASEERRRQWDTWSRVELETDTEGYLLGSRTSATRVPA